ncbi:MAG: 3-hydroxyacyl-ACP dehydratase FabZ [bacterium]
MDIREIKGLLPHRYPFLLVDRVVELEPGKSIRAYKNITSNEEIFNGHFPNAPIFPGVMIVEAMAQASGILGFASVGEQSDENALYLFAGVDSARFKRQVVPGDRMDLESEILSVKRNIWKFQCRALVDGELASEATILCALKQV